MKLIVNLQLTDPYFNLAAEEYLVRNYEVDTPITFLHVNEPSVVMGKNQNVFEEVNLNEIEKKKIKIARRISGGGTVYHDLRNLNFSFITKFDRELFNNYRKFNAPILSFLRDLGINAELNDRNDIVVEDYKISGNAQFTTKNSMLSHGTLLFDSNLDDVTNYLKPNWESIKSKSSKSFRSKVINLSSFINNKIDFQEFVDLLIEHLKKGYPDFAINSFSDNELNEINKLAKNKYQSFEWIMGRSPKCTIYYSVIIDRKSYDVEISIENARIKKIMIVNFSSRKIQEFLSKLEGTKFNREALSAKYHENYSLIKDKFTHEEYLNIVYSV